jgi:drug/metabolite transporter (DMT)-like permease
MRIDRIGTAAILGSAFGYGFLGILIKLTLAAGASPLSLVMWRFVIGAAVVWALLIVRRSGVPPRRTWPGLVGLGALYSVNATAFTVALQWIEATTASLVFYLYPVVVLVLAAIFIGEKMTSSRVAAAALAFAGCAMTAGLGIRSGNPLGVALVLLSMLSLSIYIVAGRRLLDGVPAHGSAAIMITTTAVIAIIVSAVTGDGLSLGGGTAAKAWIALLSVVSTALPITLFVIGLKRIGAGRAAIYSTIEPVVTVIAASLILGERIGGFQYLGGALILAGVIWLRLERPLPAAERPTPLDAP